MISRVSKIKKSLITKASSGAKGVGNRLCELGALFIVNSQNDPIIAFITS